jgi:creatinine amidohydrolase
MSQKERNEEILNIQELGSGEIQKKIAQGCDTVLIPIGSCERHGNPYTPLGTDGLVSFAVAERAARKADVLYTPLMPFGYAPHHMGKVGEGAGTITLSAETYRRVLMDIGRSLIFHGFNKLIFVSFHSFNVTNAEEVLFSLRFHTGAFVAFYGGRETPNVQQILGSTPDRLASDFEASMILALMGDKGLHEEHMNRSYRIHAPEWMGPAFTKRAGTGMAVNFKGSENIFLGMDDFEFVEPVSRVDQGVSKASAEKGRMILDRAAQDLAEFVEEVKKMKIEVRNRDFPDRARPLF